MKNKDIKGEASDLNQDETVEVIHIKGTPRGEWQAKNINGYYKQSARKEKRLTRKYVHKHNVIYADVWSYVLSDDYANTRSVNTGHGDLQDAEKECGWSDAEIEVYDGIGERAVCRCRTPRKYTVYIHCRTGN